MMPVQRTTKGEAVRGRLIYVMGASGSGKDSLIAELRHLLRDEPFAFARRWITRPPAADRERHVPVSPERFEALAGQGYFSLHWHCHGFRYGLPAAWDKVLERGTSLVVNGSREAFPEAAARYPDLLPVLVSVPRHILRERLLQRGRESGMMLERRLRRASMPVPGEERIREWIRIDNSGSLPDTAAFLAQALRTVLLRHASTDRADIAPAPGGKDLPCS